MWEARLTYGRTIDAALEGLELAFTPLVGSAAWGEVFVTAGAAQVA